MKTAAKDIQADVAAIGQLEAIDTVLRVLAKATGLRTSLVARVTQDSWTACAILDEGNFGLAAGDGLDVATTY